MSAYWAQFSHAEIMSMHGVEVDEQDNDIDYDYEEENDTEREEQGCCSGCMDCLGLSWRDFY